MKNKTDKNILPIGWEMKKLGDICDFKRGLTYSKKDEIDYSDNIVLRSNNIDLRSNSLDLTELRFIKPNINIPLDKKVQKGTLLICTANGSKNHLGKIALIDKDINYAFGGFMGLIIPKEGVIPKFLYYSLTSDYYKNYIDSLSDGININNLKFSDLSLFEIIMPPPEEQKRIVSILDKTFSAIDKAKENAEANLKNAKEIFESYLNSVFENKGEDWEYKKIGDIIEKTENIDPKKMPNKEFKYLDVSSVNKETKQIETCLELLGKDTPSRAKKLVKTNDVIFATVRPTHARVALITEKFDNQVCSTGYFILRPKKYISSKLIFYFILTSKFNNKMEKLQKGASYPAVTDNDVKSINISFPPLKEQKIIVEKLDKLQTETKKLEAIYKNKIECLEEMKKSVLKKAFEGKLIFSNETIETNVIPLEKINGITPIELQAGITAIAIMKHIEKNNLDLFGRVEVEKTSHLAEYVLNIDLEREPIKDVAGPNDFSHAKKVRYRAKKANYYTEYKNGNSYKYEKGRAINKVIEKTKNSLGKEKTDLLMKLLDIITPLDTKRIEVLATVYAAWNNLILEGKTDFTDEDIVYEARENWSESKLEIKRKRFFNAIEWMRKEEILIPKGNGKKVLPKKIKK